MRPLERIGDGFVERRPIVAYVLDLFGAPEREVRAWRPAFRCWTLFGERMVSESAERQWAMIRADTVTLTPPVQEIRP